MRKQRMENRIHPAEPGTAFGGAAVVQEPAYCGCCEQRLALAARSAGCSFVPLLDRRHSENLALACLRGPLERRSSLTPVIGHLLYEPGARQCDFDERPVPISRDRNVRECSLGLDIAGAGCAIWDRSRSTPSQMTAVLPCMPALTARQQSVKIMPDGKEDVVGGLDVERECPGRPRLVTREQAVNLTCDLMLADELYDIAAVRIMLQWHMRLDVERFFIGAEPGSPSQTIHVWLRQKLDRANWTSGKFLHTSCYARRPRPMSAERRRSRWRQGQTHTVGQGSCCRGAVGCKLGPVRQTTSVLSALECPNGRQIHIGTTGWEQWRQPYWTESSIRRK
jgi:hypothetical protein